MPKTIRSYQPDQLMMFPPLSREWLPEGHLAHFVSDVVDRLDMTVFHVVYEGDGRRNMPYDPVMMLKLLIYAYAVAVFSSRNIAKMLEENVAMRMLAASNRPSHRTLCRFRERHLKDFRRLFLQVVKLACRAGMAKVGTISIDGTKVRANASKRKAMSYARMTAEEKRLESEIRELLSKAAAQDMEEAARYGEDMRGDELLAHLCTKAGRTVALEEAAAHLLAEETEKEEAVVTPVICEEEKRRQKKLAMIKEAKQLLEQRQRSADAQAGRAPGQKRNPKGGPPYKRAFGVPEDKAQSNFTDPESRIMKTSQEGFQQCYNAQTAVEAENQIIVETHVTSECTDTQQLAPMVEALQQTHTPDKVLADTGYRSEHNLKALEEAGIDGYVATGREGKQQLVVAKEQLPATARMQEKLSTASGRAMYKKRKWISEAANGWIRSVLGFQRFSVRGLTKVSGEWDLVCACLNIRRLNTLQARLNG